MLFNSYIYIFCFLPIVVILYYALSGKKNSNTSKYLLILASLFFYGWWNVIYVPLIIGSALFNYCIGMALSQRRHKTLRARVVLFFGIATNLGLLAYFKYANFFASIYFDDILGQEGMSWNIVLPLAISFFTFQQIAYLVDCYKSDAHEYNLTNYLVFVFFFPQLIAGPIIHHKEMMPQFENKNNRTIFKGNIALGILIFSIGLFKKVVLADSFGHWANQGFSASDLLSLTEGWAVSLSYTLQLYFDFSGYTDMAIGSALLFNIKIPFNFNSPYKASSIQDFWRRWHMTLSRFLRDYLYIPLGGNRYGQGRTMINVMVTFSLGGLWHGAGWTFVVWGALHGLALVIFRIWSQHAPFVMPKALAWFLTFMFINATWVVFRADDMEGAVLIWRSMLNVGDLASINSIWAVTLCVGLFIVRFCPNSNLLNTHAVKHTNIVVFVSAFLVFAAIIVLEVRKTSEFLYFQF